MPESRPKPWERRAQGRRGEGTQSRRRVLIVSEDTKSSCLYLQGFEIKPERAEIVFEPAGMNTDSLVEKAIELKKAAISRGQPYSHIWCVLDRDEFPLANYSRAFELADNAGIQMAWSNEAFELWYLLHFNYHDTAISRHDYKRKLDAHLPKPYDKADGSIYNVLLQYQQPAIRNARRLEKYWNEMDERFPERKNPTTNVHKLVEFLNELKELGAAG